MFCPQCQAEYRQGFTRCADCDIDLVYALDGEPGLSEIGTENLNVPDASLRLIWKGHTETECVILCRHLMKADIPYKVAQIPESPNVDMKVIWRYEIGVQDADYERSKELLGIEGAYADGGESVEQVLWEEDDDAESLPLDDSPPGKEIRNDSYLEPWYPEDATAEIWSQGDEDISAGIEAGLKESLIHCRVDLRDGVCKVFVMPEDAERSRKIVREITKGAPE
jgi:hypothetical protein